MSKNGRPVLPIDMEKLAGLMRFKPTLADAAAFFKCSQDTIDRRIKDETGLTYAEFREQNMVHIRFSLVQKAMDKALKGDNVMIIFCLKNLCGWKNEGPDEEMEKLKKDLSDMLAVIADMRAKAAL